MTEACRYWRSEVKRLEDFIKRLIECNTRETRWSNWAMNRVVEQDDELKTKQAIIDGMGWAIHDANLIMDELTDIIGEYADYIQELTEENIKLRRTAQGLYDIVLANVCPHCGLLEWGRCDGCEVHDNEGAWRELGIRRGDDGNRATEDNTATRD